MPYEYELAEPFYEGFAAVGIRTDNGTKWGFINKTGTLVVPYEYASVNYFSDGLAAVTKNTAVESPACTCEDGYVAAHQMHRLECPFMIMPPKVELGFINTTGNLVVQMKYNGGTGSVNPSNYAYFSEGLAPVLDGESGNSNWGYINKSGEMVISSLDYSHDFPFKDLRDNPLI